MFTLTKLQKYNLKHILFSMFLWTIAFKLYIIFRFVGYSPDLVTTVMPKALLVFHHNVILTTVVGISMGLTHGILEIYIFNTKWRHMAFGRMIALRILIYTASLVIVTSILLLIYQISVKNITFLEAAQSLEHLIFDSNYLMVALFGLFISIAFFYINLILRKLGEGEILNILTGKYHKPKSEYRIFMFLDLQDSTSIAETLGHIKFSQLLQSLFSEIARFVIQFDAFVYQHVGDEIVLTWGKNTSYDQVLLLYYRFEEYLIKNRPRYENQFGITPKFRAAVSEGIITVAQIGYTKQEMAYHGDVPIIAARIQKLCKKYQEDILLSEHCLQKLNKSSIYRPRYIDSTILSGQSIKTNIYSVISV